MNHNSILSDNNKGNLYILLTAFLWSTGGILIKYIPMNALAINGSRSVIAFLCFCIYRKSIKIKINKTIVLAALSLVLTNILYVAANKLTTAANAIVLQYTAPIFVLLWDCIYRKQMPKKRQCLIVAMAFLGMILFFCDQLEGGYLLGNILAILAGLCFSGVFFINSLPSSSSEDSSMLAFVIASMVSIPFLGDVRDLDSTGWIALLILGIFQLALAYVLFAKGSKLTSPVSASLIGLLEAILNPLWVFLAFQEKIGRFALVGALVLMGAVVLNIIYGKKKE